MLRQPHAKVALAALLLSAIACGSGASARSADVSPLADLPPGDPANGEALFTGDQPGPSGNVLVCNACHSLDGSSGVGPSLQEISERVPEEYDSVEAYLYESIVQPDAFVREGLHPGIMPDFSGQQMDDQALADLIAFLAQQ